MRYSPWNFGVVASPCPSAATNEVIDANNNHAIHFMGDLPAKTNFVKVPKLNIKIRADSSPPVGQDRRSRIRVDS